MRLVVYDKTCVIRGNGLTPIWASAAHLLRARRRFDKVKGVASWREAVDWLASHDQPIREIQYWGHGKWGCAFVGEDRLDEETVEKGALDHLRERLASDALLWFRTCETFGARRGQSFAERLADRLGVRVAGHTHIIAFHQSGLHGLAPGMRAHWSEHEGLKRGTPEDPEKAKWSWPWVPRTVTALEDVVPPRWFSPT